jgi:hypothetical protein
MIVLIRVLRDFVEHFWNYQCIFVCKEFYKVWGWQFIIIHQQHDQEYLEYLKQMYDGVEEFHFG